MFDWAQESAGPSLDDARKEWDRSIKGKGGRCPCCDRWGKVYKRTINETMARSLIWLVRQGGGSGEWIDVPSEAPRWLVRSNQLATLRWWALVERRDPEPGADEKFSGMWRATERGIQFTRDKLAIPKGVFTYGGDVWSYTDELTTISACMGKRFSYLYTMTAPFSEAFK